LAIIPGLAVTFVDQAVLPVALPTIQRHLGATHAELWWCVNAYLLVSSIFLLIAGKIGDLLGYRHLFFFGMLVFALSSFFGGLSSTAVHLITARSFQGIGAALMIPAVSPILMSLFGDKERGKAIGINVSISSLFLIFAPFIGGYLTEAFSWRAIFWINLPICLIGMILLFLFIPKSSVIKTKIDWVGFFLFTLSAASLITWIMQGSSWNWTSFLSLAFLGIGAMSTALFIAKEKRSKDPLIDFSLFKHPIYKAVNISVFATQFVLMITVYRTVFFQDVLSWTPFDAGVLFSLTSVPVLFMSPIGGYLADRFGSKIPIIFGFILLIYSFFWLSFLIESSLPILLIGLFAFGFGVPLILTPSYSAAMGSIPPQKAGSAFGILATTRSLSSTLGVALISLFTKQEQQSSLEVLLKENPLTKDISPSTVKSATLSQEQLIAAASSIKQAAMNTFSEVHAVLGFALLFAFAFVLLLYRPKASQHLPKTPGEGWD
jgi:EmrB/QacA subfamily drug resistance transporter